MDQSLRVSDMINKEDDTNRRQHYVMLTTLKGNS